jgi:hypothetical protein
MDKWREIARLVNTIEECRKRLVEVSKRRDAEEKVEGKKNEAR